MYPLMGWFTHRSRSQAPVCRLLSGSDIIESNEYLQKLDSNGPIFMPNSRLMQQMLRFDFERYQEEIGDGKCPMDPTVICIPRGVIVPMFDCQLKIDAYELRYSHPIRAGTMERRRLSILPATFKSDGNRK